MEKSAEQQVSHESEHFQRPDKLHLNDIMCTRWQKANYRVVASGAPPTSLDRYTLDIPMSANQFTCIGSGSGGGSCPHNHRHGEAGHCPHNIASTKDKGK